MRIKVVMGSRYLGGFVRDRADGDSCLEEKVQGWTESAKTLLGVACKHLQSAYAGLQKSLQQEWSFMQRINPDIGDALDPAEQALQEAFIPALFHGLEEITPGRGVTRLPVKQAGLAILDPTKTAPEN